MKYAILSNEINFIKAPEWIRIALMGEWRGDMHFKIDEADLKDIVKNFYAAGRDFPVDWEHQSLNEERAPAAGWIKRMEIRGSELWANVEWTDQGRNDIETKAYKFLSPFLIWGKKDNKTGKLMRCYVPHVSLTNTPYINELKIAAKDLALCSAGKLGNGEGGEIGIAVFSENQMETRPMKKWMEELGFSGEATDEEIYAKIMALKGAVSPIAKALGLSEKATYEDALAKVIELNNTVAPIADALGDGTPADVDIVKAKIVSLKEAQGASAKIIAAKDEEIAKNHKDMAKLSDDLISAKAEKLVDLSIAGGKALPAEKGILLSDITLKDADGKYIMYDRLVNTIDYREKHKIFIKSKALSDKPKKEKKEINPEVKRISGLKDEDYDKFGPKDE